MGAEFEGYLENSPNGTIPPGAESKITFALTVALYLVPLRTDVFVVSLIFSFPF